LPLNFQHDCKSTLKRYSQDLNDTHEETYFQEYFRNEDISVEMHCKSIQEIDTLSFSKEVIVTSFKAKGVTESDHDLECDEKDYDEEKEKIIENFEKSFQFGIVEQTKYQRELSEIAIKPSFPNIRSTKPLMQEDTHHWEGLPRITDLLLLQKLSDLQFSCNEQRNSPKTAVELREMKQKEELLSYEIDKTFFTAVGESTISKLVDVGNLVLRCCYKEFNLANIEKLLSTRKKINSFKTIKNANLIKDDTDNTSSNNSTIEIITKKKVKIRSKYSLHFRKPRIGEKSTPFGKSRRWVLLIQLPTWFQSQNNLQATDKISPEILEKYLQHTTVLREIIKEYLYFSSETSSSSHICIWARMSCRVNMRSLLESSGIHHPPELLFYSIKGYRFMSPETHGERFEDLARASKQVTYIKRRKNDNKVSNVEDLLRVLHTTQVVIKKLLPDITKTYNIETLMQEFDNPFVYKAASQLLNALNNNQESEMEVIAIEKL
jgi:hypothetical protein